MNCLEKLLKRYPDSGWNMGKLSENPNMTIGIVKKNLRKNFDWKKLSRNGGITIKEIERNPNFNWSKEDTYQNPNVTREYILKNMSEYNISVRKKYDQCDCFTGYTWSVPYSCPVNIMFNNPKLMSEMEVMFYLSKHNRHYLDYRRNISFKLLDHIMFFYGIPDYEPWNLYSMSSGVTMEDVKRTELLHVELRRDRIHGEDFKDKKYSNIANAEAHSYWRKWNWNYSGLSSNPNLTIDYIRYYIKYKDFFNLKENAKYGYRSPKHTEWNWDNISKNSAFTMDHIAVNSDLPWNYQCVSANLNINMQFVLDNPDENWDWDELSRNPGIKMKDINDHSELSWNFKFVSANPNITEKFIHENFHKIDFDMLSENKFTRIKKDILQQAEADRVERKREETNNPFGFGGNTTGPFGGNTRDPFDGL